MVLSASKDNQNKRNLSDILFLLDEVSDNAISSDVGRRMQFNPMFTSFETVRDYCVLFLENSISFNYKNDLKLFAFLLPMEYVFEDFIYGFIDKEIEGVNFLFSTLWSNISEDKRWVIQQGLSDFKVIKYKDRIFNVDDYNTLHLESIAFLQKAFKEKPNNKTVVVSHHAPTFTNYPEKYANSKINEAFASNLNALIEENTIDYWIYGHHHTNTANFKIGNTQLVTNQLGYIKYNENKGFNEKALIVI